MPNAKNIIKANEKDNTVTVTLYGQEHDITKKVKNGGAHIKLYGQEYEVQVVAEKKKETKKIKVTDNSKATKPDIKFIETPIKK